jgi:hypothetical protein
MGVCQKNTGKPWAFLNRCESIELAELMGEIRCAIDQPSLRSARIDNGQAHHMAFGHIHSAGFCSRLWYASVLRDTKNDRIGLCVVCSRSSAHNQQNSNDDSKRDRAHRHPVNNVSIHAFIFS